MSVVHTQFLHSPAMRFSAGPWYIKWYTAPRHMLHHSSHGRTMRIVALKRKSLFTILSTDNVLHKFKVSFSFKFTWWSGCCWYFGKHLSVWRNKTRSSLTLVRAVTSLSPCNRCAGAAALSRGWPGNAALSLGWLGTEGFSATSSGTSAAT